MEHPIYIPVNDSILFLFPGAYILNVVTDRMYV